MSKTGRPNHRRGARGTRKAERHITVRSVRREAPDLRKLSRAVIALALREAEADAAAANTAATDDETQAPTDIASPAEAPEGGDV